MLHRDNNENTSKSVESTKWYNHKKCDLSRILKLNMTPQFLETQVTPENWRKSNWIVSIWINYCSDWRLVLK